VCDNNACGITGQGVSEYLPQDRVSLVDCTVFNLLLHKNLVLAVQVKRDEPFITLWDTKNREKRYIYMNKVVTDNFICIKSKCESEYVFPGQEGNTHISESYISHCFVKTAMKAGINDFRFHDLRHTFGSWLAMDGFSLKTIQELMGHKSIEMTLRYAHLSPEHKRLAVERLEKRSRIFDRKNEKIYNLPATNGHLLDTKSKIKEESIPLSIN